MYVSHQCNYLPYKHTKATHQKAFCALTLSKQVTTIQYSNLTGLELSEKIQLSVWPFQHWCDLEKRSWSLPLLMLYYEWAKLNRGYHHASLKSRCSQSGQELPAVRFLPRMTGRPNTDQHEPQTHMWCLMWLRVKNGKKRRDAVGWR